MIDAKRLAELRSHIEDVECDTLAVALPEVFDTLEAALKVVDVANNVLLLCRQQLRSVYTIDRLEKALAPFTEAKK